MTTIAASTSNNPANPMDYAQTMASVADAMTQNTLASFGNMISGLSTVSSMAKGAYGFEGGVINQSNQVFAQNSQQVQDFMTQNVNQILPVVSSIAQAAAFNQNQAIAAQQQAASAAANSGSKK